MNEDEIRDVVNENDEVIGQERIWTIKTKGMYHRSVMIWIMNFKGELLLQKRSKEKRLYPLTLESSASGGVNLGESYEDAARREVKEELGIELELKYIGKELLTYKLPNINNKEFTGFFIGYYERIDFVLQDEVDDIKLFSKEEIEKMIKEDESQFTPTFVDLFRLHKDAIRPQP